MPTKRAIRREQRPPRGRSLAADPTPRGAKSVPQRRLEASIELFAAELHARGLRPKTVSTYAKALRVHGAHELLEANGTTLLSTYVRLAPASRATYLAAVRAFRRSQAARDLGVPLGELDVRVTLDAPSPRPLAADVERKLERLALHHGDQRVRIWYACMRELGLRPSEPLALQWADIVLAPGRETLTVRATKGRRDAALPIERRGRCELLRLLRRAHPGGGHLELPVLASSRYGRRDPWSYSAALDAWHRLCGVADVEATPHQLRHTAATAWLEAGVDGEIVRRMLRHRSVVMIERYAELSAEGLRKGLRRGS